MRRPGCDFEWDRSNQTKKPERALRAFRRAQPVRSIVTIPEPGGPGASKVGGFYARGGIWSRAARVARRDGLKVGRNTATLANAHARMAGSVSRSIRVWPAGSEHWRKLAIVAGSVLLHVGLLGFLGLRTSGLGSPRLYDPSPTVYIQLEPRPLLADETPRQPVATSQSEAPPLARSVNAPTSRAEDEDEDEAPAPPLPRLGGPTTAAPPAPSGSAWAVRPRTLGDRIGQGLRTSTVGCAAPALLSAAERAICDDRFGQRAAAARPIDETGDSRFAREGARRLAEYEARRRPLAGGSGNVGPQDGPGSNFGMGVAGALLDPSLRPDSTENIRTRRDGPR